MNISRGEIWRVTLDPGIGAEIRKTRPAVVVSSDSVGTLPIRLVAPLTEWKDAFASKTWLVRVEPDTANGLAKLSAIDTLQLRALDTSRFSQKLGSVTAEIMAAVMAGIVAVIDYEP